MKYLLIIYLSLIVTTSSYAQHPDSQREKDSIAVAEQLTKFVEAFKNLDYEKFQSFFSKEVTAFFPPSAGVAGRIDGKENVMNVFQAFFARVKSKKSAPPYLDITPMKTEIDLEQNIAIVSFELNDDDGLSRRTIILRKEKGRFLILHLHASKISSN